MTAKEALKEIKKQIGNIHVHDFSLGFPFQTNLKLRDSEYFSVVETALNRLEEQDKVLKIIKEKGINTFYLENTDNADEYKELTKSHLGMKRLTETEFNLLKEYLK